MTYQVDIINPMGGKLLQELADRKLISIKQTTEDGFIKVVKRLRAKATKNPISLREISKEVEIVRAKRYAAKKG